MNLLFRVLTVFSHLADIHGYGDNIKASRWETPRFEGGQHDGPTRTITLEQLDIA